jgi:Helix-turn-helix domain of resolvase
MRLFRQKKIRTLCGGTAIAVLAARGLIVSPVAGKTFGPVAVSRQRHAQVTRRPFLVGDFDASIRTFASSLMPSSTCSGYSPSLKRILRKERQMEGIARAKANGVYVRSGRPASIDVARVREMKAQGLGALVIAKELGIGRASVYRMLEANSI